MATASNAVVYVGGEGLLFETAKHAALNSSGASVMPCDVASVANVATECRPYAIIVPRMLYEFGGDEFNALARDVDAELIVVPEGIKLGLLTTLLSEAAHRLG